MRVVGPGRSLEAAVSCVFSVRILHSLRRAASPDWPRAKKAPHGRPAKVTAETLPARRAEVAGGSPAGSEPTVRRGPRRDGRPVQLLCEPGIEVVQRSESDQRRPRRPGAV